MSGTQSDGKVRFSDVPVVFSGWSRIVQQMFGGIGDNIVPKLPMMSYSLKSINRKTPEIRDPKNIQQYVVRTRKRDGDGNLLVNEPGKVIVVERYMPVPYTLEIELVIWASNYDQLMQLIEQIGSEFNPDLEFVISNSPVDWTSPTNILMTGSFRIDDSAFSEKPDAPLIARASFIATSRISIPVRVYDATLIHEIDVNIREMEDFGYMYFGDNIDLAEFPKLDELTIVATEQEILDHEGQ
jgi:hypothetical protein